MLWIWLKQFFTNDILWFSMLSNILAQFIKVLVNYIHTKRFDFRLAFSTGGNPSSHTATVTTLTIILGARYGFNSPYFTISFIMAGIVVIDALNVRREVGEHSKTMNEIFLETSWGKKIAELIDVKTFKELVGHTGSEVFAGFVLGILVAIIDLLIFPVK
jgi:acid phosphatase family membrane protein YuiD